jgi:hypothetical protein
VISKPEGELLDAIHWRMPRWSGESINESGIADDAHVIMSDASFEAWLGEHMAAQPQPLLQVVDLWVPADCLPAEVARPMPTLPQPAQPTRCRRCCCSATGRLRCASCATPWLRCRIRTGS